jgi:putative membrane protein
MPTRIMKNCVLTAWAVFFAWLVSFGQGTLARLLHPHLWWLVVSGAVILLLFLAVNLTKKPTVSQKGIALRWQWPSLAILLVPLLYWLPVHEARLNADTFFQKSLRTDEGFLIPGYINMSANGEIRENEMDTEVSLIRLYSDTGQYLGQEVDVVCRILQDRELPDELLVCYRFRITCCAADALPVFILIKKNKDAVFTNDSWVRAKGQLAVYEHHGYTIPLITGATLTVVNEPSFLFLF